MFVKSLKIFDFWEIENVYKIFDFVTAKIKDFRMLCIFNIYDFTTVKIRRIFTCLQNIFYILQPEKLKKFFNDWALEAL
jgi:hypothetical protein